MLDLGVLQRNLDRVADKARLHQLKLRPHLKTAKSAEIARRATARHFGGITVSTLREAEYFLEVGFTDLTYSVGITPDKLADVTRLQQAGARLNILLDDVALARHLSDRDHRNLPPFRVFLEIDCGYGRSGQPTDAEAVVEIARLCAECAHIEFRGVLSHAGHSYHAGSIEEIREIAASECAQTVAAAERIRASGLPCPEVSVGSTPTFVHGEAFPGVTEVRPGNYMFFDLSMRHRGVCEPEDIAVSVLTSVIASRAHDGRVLVDAGCLAMSKDNGGAGHPYGYGLVRDKLNQRNHGKAATYILGSLSQEQGWVARADGAEVQIRDFAIGDRLRILPNHSCMTAAAFDSYHVVDGGLDIVDHWGRCHGW